MMKVARRKKSGTTRAASYDERSPLTGNFKVLVESVKKDNGTDDLYKVCIETGYQTYWNTWTTDNTEALAVIERQMPEYVVNAKHIQGNHVWYPMMSISPYGVLHPLPGNDGQLSWAISDIKPIQSNEESEGPDIVRLPIQTNDGVKIAMFKMQHPPIMLRPLNGFEEVFHEYQNIMQNNIIADEEE